MTDAKTLPSLPIARRTFIGLSAAAASAWVLPGSAAAASDVARLTAFDAEQAAALFVITQCLIPMEDTPARVYHDIVAALDRAATDDAGFAQLIGHALVTARLHLSQSLPQVPSDRLTAYLRTIEPEAFFQQVYATTLATFFAHPEVWQRIGYEGESFSKGGYLLRGFNDLDWLPEPPLTVQGPLPF